MHAILKAFVAAMALSWLAASTAAAQGVPEWPASAASYPPAQSPRQPSAGLVQVPIYQKAIQASLTSPEAREASKRFGDLEAKSLDLVRQIQALALKDGPAVDLAKERGLLRKRLEETVNEAFDARQKLQQLEVQELKQRLAKVEGGVEKREEHKDQIVESRIAELLGENQELRWDPAGAPATRTPPTVIRGAGSAPGQAAPTFPGGAPKTPANVAPPALEGVVLAVSENDLVELSPGAEDGLEKGHQLDVFRGSTYLGKVEVIAIKPSASVARIMTRRDNDPIRKGDRVRTANRLPTSAPSTSGGRAVPRGDSSRTFQPAGPGIAAAAPAAAPDNPFAAAATSSHRSLFQQQMLLSHLAETRKALIDTEHSVQQAERKLNEQQPVPKEAKAEWDLARRHADRVQREYESQLRLLDLNVQAAHARLENAEREFERVASLAEKGVITPSELESRRTAVELAEKEVEFARTLLNLHREATASPEPKDEAPEEREDAPNNAGGFF